MEEFKPKNKRISQEEKKALFEINLKWCGICKKVLSLDSFYNLNFYHCIDCARAKSQKKLNKNRTEINRKRQERRAANIEVERQKQKEWADKNRERKREQHRKWYSANKDQWNRKRREVHYQNTDFFKRRDDPVFRLKLRIRTRTNTVFKKKNIKKNSKSGEMLGCNWEELKAHIENQFTEGMSWDRIGEIHIDHIIPLVSAKTEEELIKLAHYTNLQPLWAKDNLSKGGKINY